MMRRTQPIVESVADVLRLPLFLRRDSERAFCLDIVHVHGSSESSFELADAAGAVTGRTEEPKSIQKAGERAFKESTGRRLAHPNTTVPA